MKKAISLALALVLAATLLCGCTSQPSQPTTAQPDSGERVTLTLCAPWTASKALEAAAQSFTEQNPSCDIQYEYVQNYEELLATRLQNAPETVDLFVHNNIQEGSNVLEYTEELFSHKELNLADTNPALIKNFTYITTDKSAADRLYTIPMGGELRGLYVNKTLLASQGLEVPTTLDELLHACQVLKDAGYVPIHGNPGVFGQRLLYPYVCSLIANAADYQATYDRVNNCEAGVSELFREPMQVMYTLMSNYYYNYKYVENELGMFTDMSDEGVARDFFNIRAEGDSYAKADDVGTVAFMVGTLTQQSTMDKTKEDYHSGIEYEFVMSPVSATGGYAYISPGQGIAVNKNSTHMDWAIKFLNFLFTKDVNTEFAGNIHYIPNTTDSFGFVHDMFNIPETQICDLGQVTFNFKFYDTIVDVLTSVSKGNNPKYMDTDADGNAAMYSFDHYMQSLEEAFAAQRESRAQ